MVNILRKTSDLLPAMEANYITYFTCFAQVPYMELHSNPEITCLASSKLPGWNTVLRTRLAPEHVPARVGAILHHFRTANRPLTWLILPTTQPADLGHYLEASGMKPVGGQPHMLVDLLTLPSKLPTPAGLTIERVHDRAGLNRWFQASVAGFEPSSSQAQIYFDAYTLHTFDRQGPFLHYVGCLHGEPVTSSTLLLAAGIAGIYDVSTAPAARGHGLGTAITLFPLLEARARGYRYACLQSTLTGYSLYRRLGFAEQFRENNYRWDLTLA